MSHEATNWARVQRVGNSSAKFILLLLADFAGTDWSCYPGVDKLAYLAEMDERTVRRATARLVDLGLIRTFYRHRDNGSRRSCRYQLLPDGEATPMPDVDDWSAIRAQSPDEANRAESPEAPGRESGPPRAESPVIPYRDPSPVETPPVIPAAPQRKTATRVPDDFQPTDDLRAWFVVEQLGAVIDGKLEHEKFMDYWRAASGANARKHDWPATWRNWMRRAAERAPRRPGTAVALPPSGRPNPNDPMGVSYQPGRSTTDDRVMQGLALVQQFRLEEENKA